jgi:antitoxin MazE
VRIPAAVTRTARFGVGQPVEVSAQDSNVLIRSIGEPKLTLEQKLAAFDPVLHGGEVMATCPLGKEVLTGMARLGPKRSVKVSESSMEDS